MILHVGRLFVLKKHDTEACAPPGRGGDTKKILIDDTDECLAARICLINNDQTASQSMERANAAGMTVVNEDHAHAMRACTCYESMHML